ncbi:MAG: SusD/RagB family nutrient-binding outer membrane lipoprotein [Schleiferiaceae bacterium]|nr:SusD/RagB family nutrient-binding outer membrane lipoprotein [Schleiferiaceae bacterium]
MKKYLLILIGAITFASCEDLTDLNENPKDPATVPAGNLLANAQVELVDYLSSTNVNVNTFRLWSQQWSQTTYVDESNYELVERDVNGTLFNTMYAQVLRDLQEAEKAIANDGALSDASRKRQNAILEVMRVYAYSVLVDAFGDVPYEQALQGTDNATPAYDDDEAIYTDLVSRLTAAMGNLDGGASGFGGNDLIYGGNTAMWKKLAASLKLRLAIRMADALPAAAQAAAEEAAPDVFASSAEDATLAYQSAPPNTNPLWEDLVQSGRTDFIASATLGDLANQLNDPRRGQFFRNLDSTGAIIGAPHGQPSAYPAHSQPSDMLEDPTLRGVLMSHTEVSFLLADAAARGFNVPGTAADHYEAGIRSSIDFWGGTTAEADAFLAQTDVQWDAAKWKELIGTQKYLAMYNRGFEAYCTYRLYDAPTMEQAAEAGTTPPTRFNYPVDEYALNDANVSTANGGADEKMGKVFWDVN